MTCCCWPLSTTCALQVRSSHGEVHFEKRVAMAAITAHEVKLYVCEQGDYALQDVAVVSICVAVCVCAQNSLLFAS
jgi:hypothetical protein